MKEEKMMILSMLEEGKITSEEAVRLMEALEEIDIPINDNESRKENQKNDFKEEKTSSNKFNTLEDISSDISNALSNMLNGLKDIGNSFGFRHNYESISNDLDMNISHIENPSLDLRAVNGSIQLRPTKSDKLSIKVLCQHKKGLLSANEPYFDFYMDGNKVIFNPKYNSGISIKLDVLLPEKNYDSILLNSTNGKIDVDKLNIDTLKCITSNSAINILYVDSKDIILSTKNGRIESQYTNSDRITANTTNSNILLMYINSNDMDIKTANGKIDINNIDGENILCKTSNGSIGGKEISCATVHLTTSNGKIACDDIDMNKAQDIKLITSNGSISSKIHGVHKEVSFDLETSMGGITLEIPNLIYKTNKQVNLGLKKIVAHTINFNDSDGNLKFIASTSNGSIQIS